MKPALQLKLSQHLALTPQLQQSIKLLQLSTLELNQEIERLMLENPLLEREDDEEGGHHYEAGEGGGVQEAGNEASLSREQDQETRHQEDFEAGREREDNWEGEGQDFPEGGGSELEVNPYEGSYPSASRDEDDETDAQEIQPATTSLRDHLAWQLGTTPLEAQDRALVRLLIEALDDDGYLTQPLEDILEGLEDPELELEDLQIALKYLQNFDPTGIGARDARECLDLQLAALPADGVRTLAQTIVRNHLDLLANRDFTKLRKLTGADEDMLRAAHGLILSLNPRPGAQFAPLDTRYITPDVIVRKVRNQWTASINPDAYPKLRVNRLYAEILSRNRRGENGGLSGQLQEARWLIKNVQQRFDTILRVSQAIVERQRQFFEHGEVAMRPLVLREIADILDLHESTVSRVTTQKYMATPRGIFELKYFFGSHVATDTGGACSATAIRALIKQLTASENPKKPLSDSQISELLGQQGIVVARRTIAKYREALGIPPANLRKTL